MLLGTLGGKGTIRAGEGTVRTYFERDLKIHRKKIYLIMCGYLCIAFADVNS